MILVVVFDNEVSWVQGGEHRVRVNLNKGGTKKKKIKKRLKKSHKALTYDIQPQVPGGQDRLHKAPEERGKQTIGMNLINFVTKIDIISEKMSYN